MMMNVYAFDLCAIVILLLTFFCMFYHKDLHKPQNKIFISMLSVCAITTGLDFIKTMFFMHGLDGISDYSAVVYYAYSIFHVLIPYMVFMYAVVVSGAAYGRKNLFKAVYTVPVVGMVIALLLNSILNNYLFVVEKDGVFIDFRLRLFFVWYSALYLLSSFFYLIKYRRNFRKRKVISIMLFYACNSIACIIQIKVPVMHMEFFFLAISCLGLLFTIEDQGEVRNSISGVYTKEAFYEDVNMVINSGKKYELIVVKITNMHLITATLGYEKSINIQKFVAEKLIALDKKLNIYDLGEGKFGLTYNSFSSGWVGDISEIIRRMFTTAWDYEGMELPFHAHVYKIIYPDDISSMEFLMDLINTNVRCDNEYTKVIEACEYKYIKRKQEVMVALEKALEKETLQVYFQPIWDAAHDRIRSAEALVQLYDDKLGLISSEEFIPMSEENGSVVRVGQFVFEEACRLYSNYRLRDYGIEQIEINLSPIQCMQRNLTEQMKNVVKKYGISTSTINLEITESAFASNKDIFMQTIDKLSAQGFRFSLDDFGTGFSNAAVLPEIDFEYIKVDKSILWNSQKSRKAKILLEQMITLVQAMDMKTIVEGVETEAQKDYLLTRKIDYIQGFYFSKAIPVTEFVDFCKDFNKVIA